MDAAVLRDVVPEAVESGLAYGGGLRKALVAPEVELAGLRFRAIFQLDGDGLRQGQVWEYGFAIGIVVVSTFVYIYVNANCTSLMLKLNSRLEQLRKVAHTPADAHRRHGRHNRERGQPMDRGGAHALHRHRHPASEVARDKQRGGVARRQ